MLYPKDSLWPDYKDMANSSKYENKLRMNNEPNVSMLCTTKASLWRIGIIKSRRPRNSQKIGQVEKLIEGKDGHCRAMIAKMSNCIRLTRAVRRLYPLEISGSENLASKSLSPPEYR
ncbi:hypothetical protein DINM_001409 [Dirofilaria immitis]|nr:hypothetical protein [Dirofilaria immitis]